MNEPTESTKPETYIAHYKLGKIIGRGGMGLVYLAEDTRLNRRVAIKCLRTELFEPHYRERFRREALLLAKLNHPHIVHIYDYIESDDQMALVMEYIDGQNLQSLLREQIVPIHQRMRWLVQIAQGLAVAHEAGIIHRDLKQENILINKQGMAKISDLGIAKSQDFNATLTDHVAGSYCSMSPEQAMGETLSFKSDLFSFGILAYQLLCGTHPFGDAENKLQIMQRIITHPPIAPSKSNPDLPAELGQLLGQLLSKNPERRPDSTHWVAGQLELLSDLLQEESPTDDTIAIGTAAKLGTLGRATRAKMTREHATFDTRYQGRRFEDQNRAFIKQHWALLVFVFALVIAVTGVSIWQMQPKQPKYVAVIPPVITVEGLSASQQNLIKNVIYDALQQGALQLHGFFLIPREEMSTMVGNAEDIWRATAADEILSTDIQCQPKSCNITIARLKTIASPSGNRLGVSDTRTLEVLTDDIKSIAAFTKKNLGNMYSESLRFELDDVSTEDYAKYIQAYTDYQEQGASNALIETLESLPQQIRDLTPIQMLYMNALVDLYFERGESSFLNKIEASLVRQKNDSDLSYLYRLYAYQTTYGDVTGAIDTIQNIEKINPNPAELHKLYGNTLMANNDHMGAIEHYKKALRLRNSAATHYSIALAYWYVGEYGLTETHLHESLLLLPSYYKAHRMSGVLALTRGNPELALASFNRINTDQDLFVTTNTGLSHLLLHDFSEAVKYFEKALEIAPADTLSQLNLADALHLNGNKDDANAIYQAIASLPDTKNSEILAAKAQANAHLNNFSDAIKQIRELQRIDAQNVNTFYVASLVYSLAGEPISALVHAEDALGKQLHPIWFSFAWFDSLCNEVKFSELLKGYGAPSRCAP